MALIYPVSSSTFGDSRETAGAPALRKYILAQFQSDADLEWVLRLRAKLGHDELKYRDFQPEHRRLKSSEPELYKIILKGIAQANVIVIDPGPIADLATDYYLQQRAEPGIDFTESDIINTCAVCLISETPLAYLPNKLWLESEKGLIFPPVKLSSFAPADLLKKVGGLRGAKVLAARAHAMFDVKNKGRIGDFAISPLRDLVFREILLTTRFFDTEHVQSVEVLNEAADVIASTMHTSPWFEQIDPAQPLIRECSSRDIDLLQAADMAAGWAGDILELQDVRAIANTFRRVMVNGKVLESNKDGGH
jgi:hypothetical protein